MTMAERPELDEESLQQIYTWIDDIPLSRPKKNITRDFSDGVLIAEIIHHFLPKIVDLHNYTAASSSTTKLDNWNLLSRKCFTKLGYNIDENLVKGAVSCKAGVIELILLDLRQHVESYQACKKAATLVEKQKYHDEISPEGYNYDPSEQYHLQNIPNGYNGAVVNGYGYPYGVDPSAPHQSAGDNYMPQYQYQYQSQPIASLGGDHVSSMPVSIATESEGYSKANTENTQKSRKPVTQASKMKTKQISPSKAASTGGGGGGGGDVKVLRIALEEKEQALLASQETVQILQAKIRRLEHLLHLKDLRINEIKNHQQPSPSKTGNLPPQSQQQTNINQPRHFPPNQNFPMQHAPPHGFNNFPPHPPLPQIPRPGSDESRKYQQR